MFKVMLVDDDIPVLEFLKQKIPWERLGLRLQGAYDNGLDAYEQALADMPDILVTDIGMPQMDGIELIGLLKRANPRLSVVILSCHDDFKLAQQAIKLNVNDYVLKETIQPESVSAILENVIDRKKKEEAERQHDAGQQIDNGQRSLWKEKFIRSTLYNPILDHTAWAVEARQFGIQLERHPYMPILGCIDRYHESRTRFVSDENCIFAVENIVGELLAQVDDAAYFRVSFHELLLFYAVPSSLKVNRHELIRDNVKQIQAALNKYIKVGMTFVLGETSQDVRRLKENTLALLNGREQRFYAEPGSICKHAMVPFAASDLFSFHAEAVEQFRQIVMAEAYDAIEPAVRQWTKRICDSRFHPEMVKEWFLKIMLDLQIKYKTMQHFRSIYSREVLHRTFLDIDSLDLLKEFVVQFLREAIPLMNRIDGQSQRAEIWEVQRFVDIRVHRKITLEEAAEHLHLNPSYFSRLYKKETGKNFIEYVTRTKMEKAKEWFDQSNRSVEDVADSLGYDNKSYFVKLFKNYTGMTPSEFMGKRRK